MPDEPQLNQEQKDAQKKERLFDQTEVNYTPVSIQMGKACAGCRWFEAYGDWDSTSSTPACHLVYSWPQSIQPTGYCERYEAYPSPEPLTQTPMPVVIVEADALETGSAELKRVDKGLVERVVKSFRESIERIVAPEPQPLFGGFKVYKDKAGQDRWLALYSNNFEDRDSEYFSEKGIDDFVKRVDMGTVAMPQLWSWHTPGSAYGKADWVDRIGHFAVASGTYDETPAGIAGKAYDQKHADEYGVSHGFLFTEKGIRLVDGKRVYEEFNTFEISPLPKDKAANVATAFAVGDLTALKEADMSPEKRKHLVDKYGEDYVVKEIEGRAESLGKNLETLKGYKDFVHPEGETEVAGAKENLAKVETAFKDLIPVLIEGTDEAVSAATKAVEAVAPNGAVDTRIKALETENSTLKSELADIRKELALKPKSVTQGGGAVLDPEKGKEVYEEVAQQFTKHNNFWNTDEPVTP